MLKRVHATRPSMESGGGKAAKLAAAEWKSALHDRSGQGGNLRGAWRDRAQA